MSNPPFVISSDAAVWIFDILRTPPREADSAKLVPVLWAYLGDEIRDELGHVIERYSALGFDIGWDAADIAIINDYPEIEVLGERVFVQPETLELLKAKTLTLVTVEVGYPDTASTTRQVLTCQ
jgi:hypothetical protein